MSSSGSIPDGTSRLVSSDSSGASRLAKSLPESVDEIIYGIYRASALIPITDHRVDEECWWCIHSIDFEPVQDTLDRMTHREAVILLENILRDVHKLSMNDFTELAERMTSRDSFTEQTFGFLIQDTIVVIKTLEG